MKEFLTELKNEALDFKGVMREYGILRVIPMYLVTIIIFVICLPFILVSYPFIALNEWSKGWFPTDNEDNTELK